MMLIHTIAKSLVVLDHHASAEKHCGDLEYCTFDMKRSGAQMAWDYCYPRRLAPVLIRYIQDRDLWQWKLAHSREVCAYMDTYPWIFKEWDRLSEVLEGPGFNGALDVGQGIIKFSNLQIKMLCKRKYILNIGGMDVPTVNTATFRSEVCDALLSETSPASATYSFNGEKYVFSLRSDGRVDVSELAGKYPGGGGHKNASGFSLDRLEDL
jgi:oligoribonuclease NrnB/cAMP/cGMP phosphodiesterase (DHH superfamily)